MVLREKIFVMRLVLLFVIIIGASMTVSFWILRQKNWIVVYAFVTFGCIILLFLPFPVWRDAFKK